MKLIPWRQRGDLTALRSEFDDMLSRFFADEPLSVPALLRTNGNPLPALNVAETEKSWTLKDLSEASNVSVSEERRIKQKPTMARLTQGDTSDCPKKP